MTKKTFYISILVLSVLGLIVFEWIKPKPINWNESYSGFDKQPYGCFIMRNVLPTLFPHQPFQYQSKPVFTTAGDSPTTGNTIFINSSFSPDSIEAVKLYNQVKRGKTIFISAKSISGKLADTLNIAIGSPEKLTIIMSLKNIKGDSIGINLANSSLHKKNPWHYFEATGAYHFSAFDTLHSTVLGTNTNGDANYIKIKKGKGTFLLHTVPFAFTNFYMRKQAKAKYAFNVLSYLPVAPTVWDEYYKTGRSVNGSPLRYIVSQRSLRWAWITALIALFLFLIFRTKRRQRIIPELKRPENTTLEFATTIGRLYHQNGNHKDIASKRITYLMEYMRNKLNLDSSRTDDAFINVVAQRSGVKAEIVESMFNHISAVQKKSSISDRELWQLNNQIETFYNQSLR